MRLFISFSVITQLLAPCFSSGVLEMHLVSFTNTEGRRRDTHCCDPVKRNWLWDWWTVDETCSADCNHVFSFCLGNNNETSSMMACEYGRVRSKQITSNHIQFGENVGGISNPIKFAFTAWSGVVNLKLDILDQDGPQAFDFIDYFEYQYSPRDVRRHSDAPPKRLFLVGSRTEINLELRVYCDIFYFGKDCTTYCKAMDNEHGHYRCNSVTGKKECNYGWGGPECLNNLNDCYENRCQKGSTCIDQIGYYICKCPPGKTGLFCDSEINECTDMPCQNGGDCQDRLNGFTCDCPRDWTGIFCETRIMHCTKTYCVHGYCTMTDGKDTCVCNEGYSGELCNKTVSGCADEPCVHMKWCEDLSEGGYKCVCEKGFKGKNCDTKISICDSSPCLHNGACSEHQGSYMCVCPDGYYGANCEQYIDKCYIKPCQNGGTCINKDGGYRCVCPSSTDGPNCEVFLPNNLCISSPCKNKAVCIPGKMEDYICECATGYTGRICDAQIDYCDSQPCLHGGTCSNMLDAFECNCDEGYTGRVCEEDINDCELEPCMNGGTCTDKLDDFFCSCSIGFTGFICEDILEEITPYDKTLTTELEVATRNYIRSETSSPTVPEITEAISRSIFSKSEREPTDRQLIQHTNKISHEWLLEHSTISAIDSEVVTVPDDTDVEIVSGDPDVITVPGDTYVVTVSGGRDVVTVPDDTDVITVSDDTDVITVSGDRDVLTLSGDRDVVTVPADTDVITVSGDTDVVTVPDDTNVITVSGDRDVLTLSGDRDVVTVPADTDVITVSGDTDVVTVPDDTNVITVSGD